MADVSVPVATGAADATVSARPRGSRVWRRLIKDPSTLAAMGGLLILIIAAIFAPYLAPYDPYESNLLMRLQGPSAKHWLGTDELGRDILSRLLYGARQSLLIGIFAVAVGFTGGVFLGVLAGFYRRLDKVFMPLIDIMMSFPTILVAMAIVGALGPGLTNAMLAVGISSLPQFTRLTRSSVLSLREREFVEAARALGASNGRIIWKHIIPNAITTVAVYGTLQLGNAILLVAILSFLGLGAQPPQAEWGFMASAGRHYLFQAPHVATFPSLAIFWAVLCFNLIGDGLRDAFDPRLGQ